MPAPPITINDTLVLLRDLLAGADLAPAGPPAAVWAYPEDAAVIDVSNPTYPFIIVAHATDQQESLTRFGVNRGRLQWWAEINIVVAPGPVENDEQYAAVKPLTEPWLYPVSVALFGNMTLGNAAVLLGQSEAGGQLLLSDEGGIMWADRIFWGKRLLLPVRFTYTMEVAA